MSTNAPERGTVSARLATVLLLAVSCGTNAARPDVLIVVADDLSWRELDEIETPSLDRLATAGVRFEGMYAASPSCSPFRGSFLFGIRPDRASIGRPVVPIRKWGTHKDLSSEDNPSFPDDLYSLADLARDAGYSTAAFGKCHLANQGSPRSQDYMRQIGFERWLAGSLYGLTGYGGPNERIWHRIDDGRWFKESTYNPEAINRAVIDWWNETEGPRFAYVAHHLPHSPFHHPSGRGPDDDAAKYRAMVSELDLRVGQLLDGIGFWQAQQSTLVTFIADNGTPPTVVAGDRISRVKRSVYEDGVRVPTIIAGWRIAGDRTTSRQLLASSTDFAATFSELWAVPLPPGAALDSESFLPALTDPRLEHARELVFAQHWEPNGDANPTKDPCSYMVLRQDGMKLVREGMISAGEAGHWELYDIAADPLERHPLDGEAIPEELRAALIERARW